MLQLECIHYLHKIRSPFLDRVITLCDFLDRQEFLFILIPIIWFAVNWKWGMRIFYLLSLSHILNYSLKNFFSLPRPFHLDPNLGIIQVQGYGFPSGAAQTAILLSGLLLLYWKSRWKWVVAITYALLLSFSRVYLGVHFPMDILGGWAVGLLLIGIYLVIFPRIEKFFKYRSPVQSLLIQFFFLTAMMFCFPSKTLISICACGIGLATGIFIVASNHRLLPQAKWEICVRILIAIMGTFMIDTIYKKIASSLVEEFFNVILYGSIGFWISFGSAYIVDLVENFTFGPARKFRD